MSLNNPGPGGGGRGTLFWLEGRGEGEGRRGTFTWLRGEEGEGTLF